MLVAAEAETALLLCLFVSTGLGCPVKSVAPRVRVLGCGEVLTSAAASREVAGIFLCGRWTLRAESLKVDLLCYHYFLGPLAFVHSVPVV